MPIRNHIAQIKMPSTTKLMNPTASVLEAAIATGYASVGFDGTVPKRLAHICPLIDDDVCPGKLYLIFNPELIFVHGKVRKPLPILENVLRAYLVSPTQSVIGALYKVNVLTIVDPIHVPYSIAHLTRIRYLRCRDSQYLESDFNIDHLKHLITYGSLERYIHTPKPQSIYRASDAKALIRLKSPFDLHLYDDKLAAIMYAVGAMIPGSNIHLIGNCDFRGWTLNVDAIKSVRISGEDHPDLSVYWNADTVTLDNCITSNIIYPPRLKALNLIGCTVDSIIPMLKTVTLTNCIIGDAAEFISVDTIEITNIVDKNGQSLKLAEFLDCVKHRKRIIYSTD